MIATDFSFSGYKLSDFKFILCNFGNKSDDISNGSKLEFKTVSVKHGSYFLNASALYSEALTINFSICKNPCLLSSGRLEPIDIDESTSIMRWLNCKTMKFLKIDDIEYENVNFEGSFTDIERVEYNGRLYGFNLTFTTNRPFGVGDKITRHFSLEENHSALLYDTSDEIGYIYPSVFMDIKQSGNLSLKFAGAETTNTVIKNVESGDKIFMKYPCIYEGISENSDNYYYNSNAENKFTENFNFVFPRISNDMEERVNTITSNLNIDLIIEYYPIRKVGA